MARKDGDNAKSTLREYKDKRDFRKTTEPEGSSSASTGQPRFVIQKHDASTLHYDFRLEVDGVLKSWVIPKGPSTDPSENRLALQTEDHPLDYAGFEGVIPEDEYGGGTVIVWDGGTYRNLGEKEEGDNALMDASLEAGKVKIWLDGKKLRGGYALIRTGEKSDNRWLFKKMKDDEADARRNPVSTQPRSILSDKTIDEMAEEMKDQ